MKILILAGLILCAGCRPENPCSPEKPTQVIAERPKSKECSTARIFTYTASKDVPTPAYADREMTIPLPNPFQVNCDGSATFWASPETKIELVPAQ